MKFVIQKFCPVKKAWVAAFGLTPRSYLRQYGHAPTSTSAARAHFLADTKRCRQHLLLVAYPDKGNTPIIVDEVNGTLDLKLTASELLMGKHPRLMSALTDRCQLDDLELGTDAERQACLAAALLEKMYPEQRVALMEGLS